jgi:hypothetical protein
LGCSINVTGAESDGNLKVGLGFFFMQEQHILAERLRARTKRKPSYLEEDGAEEEEDEDWFNEEGDGDDEVPKVQKSEQVGGWHLHLRKVKSSA